MESLDVYWGEIYRAVGVGAVPFTVESFVDSQALRPYFNTHCFSINPAKAILRAWRECFKRLVDDNRFQQRACPDEAHRIFLHQAVLSALVTKSVDRSRLCVLPLEYSYPLHLQNKIPESRRVGELERLVCVVYEDSDIRNHINAQSPLALWLAAHHGPAGG